MTQMRALYKGAGRSFASLSVATLIVAGLLAGCASVTDVADSVNPFKEKEVILPGERQSMFATDEAIESEDSSPVSIGGAVAFTSWGQVGGPLTNNPPNVSYSGQGSRVWSAEAAIRGGEDNARAGARPVSYGGRVAVYSPNGEVALINASNGGRIWKVSVRPENEKGIAPGGAVAMDSARVFAATGFSELIALEGGSGRRLWTFQLDAPARGAPVVVGDKVLAVTATNSIYAVSVSDGTELWAFNGIPEGTGLVGAAAPAVSGKTVLFTGTSGELVALNLNDGEMIWSDTVVRGTRRFAVSGISSIAGGPVIDDGVAYVSSVSGNTAALRLKDGDRLWDRSIGSSHAPVVSGNSMFVIDLDDRVFALNRKNGKIRWSSKLPSIREKKKRSTWAGPILAGSRLWFASSEGQLAGVDPKTGQISVTRDINDPVYIAPIAVGGRLITLSGSGRLSGYN
ncbi:Outer membrane protein assembly factor BamB, contains PQQ-like beta-propeller repeat [Cohaesibacter sp. ES.047]|uniref:outer membrane protein assembly factor BamB family protein n=1 Tax=Cohaesibacter sp. ES.047 TaxID=1798205 RepID=UPI000BB81006|nr:PQQ-binding-like beta-propeller repeat protein [Cohaesibacter sp. ES.047]SNY93871.1 Outer membrane protein assembly factor BamB, contains PQQ-like beta-propeller repeat [Cohaesibacter sp. ES.047]